MSRKDRRTLLGIRALVLLLVLGLGLGLAGVSCTKWTPSLRILTFRDRQSAALRESLPEFEKTYGIRVQMDDIPAESMATKMMTDLAAGGTYDVYAMDEPFVPQFASSLLPVKEWPDREQQWDPKAFEDATLEAASVGGVLMGLPVNGNVYQYIYRKDLFESPLEKENYLKQYGKALAPAKTFAEILELARFFHRPPQLYGFAPFTKMSEGTTVELLWLFSGFGMTPGRGAANRNTIEEALNFYGHLLKTAPKSAKSWHHTERMTAYAKGKIAQIMTWNSFFFDLEDEDKSLVVGKTGYAPSPGTSKTSIAGSWIAGIRRGSRELEHAADFVRWWTSKALGEKLIPLGLSSPRRDLLTEPRLSQKFPWLEATHLNFEAAFLRPRHADYRSISSDLSKVFTRWMAGQEETISASEQLASAYTRLERISSLPSNSLPSNSLPSNSLPSNSIPEGAPHLKEERFPSSREPTGVAGDTTPQKKEN